MFLRAKNQFISFEGDDDAAAAEATAKAAAAEATVKDEKIFNQDQVNTMIAEEKRKNQVRERKILGELQDLKKNVSLTAEEKNTLEKRIEDLQTQNMTVEEKARRAEELAEKKTFEQVLVLTTERDNWQSRHADLVINTAIITAASEGENKALFLEPILAILQPKTKLAEILDDDGRPTDKFEPRVSFPDKDKDDKPLVLELTVVEAIKRMKELERYGNLFEGTKKSGLGGIGNTTKGGKIDLAKIAREDPAKYRELREKRPELF